MNGQWDFTIGLRETRDLYLLLMREKWRGGILGFGAAGALTAVLYTGELGLSPPLRAAAVLAGAGLVMLLAWAALTLSTAAREASTPITSLAPAIPAFSAKDPVWVKQSSTLAPSQSF